MFNYHSIKTTIKQRLGPIWWYSFVLFFAQRFGDLINIYIGLWLVPKYVPSQELGALLPLTQITGFLGLPLAILLTPFTKFINTFAAKEEYGKVKALVLDALVLLGLSSVAVGIYTWYTAPFIFERLRISSSGLIWILCGITVTSLVIPLTNGALSALKNFRIMGFAGFAATPVRLFVLLLLLPVSGLLGYFASQLALNLFICIISFWGLRHLISKEIHRETYSTHWREMILYTLPFILMTGVGTLSTTVQYLTIRQRLPAIESAAFYFCSRFSEIPNIFWSAIASVFFPIISDAFEKGKNTHRMFIQVLAVSLLGGGAMACLLGLSMTWLFGQVNAWEKYGPYAYLVGWLALTNVFRVGFACFTTYEMACRRFAFLWYSIPIALAESAFLIAFTGYGFFTPYFPAHWVDWMASLRVARLEFIVGVMFVTALIPLMLVLTQSLIRTHRFNTEH